MSTTDPERAQQMRVLWQKARNMYGSFFVLLDQQRQEIGDAALGDWCFHELKIGLEVCLEVSKCLKEADRKRVQSELAVAKQLERAKKQAELEAFIKAQAAAKAARDADKVEKEAEAQHLRDLADTELYRGATKITPELVAELKIRLIEKLDLYGAAGDELMKKYGVQRRAYEGAIGEARGELRAEAAFYKIDHTIVPPPAKPPTKARSSGGGGGGRKKRTDSRDTITTINAQSAAPAPNGDQPKPEPEAVPAQGAKPLTDEELVMGINAALARVASAGKTADAARREWIEATLKLSELLGEARRRYPSNPQLGKWRRDHGIGPDIITEKDFTALVSMSADLTTTRAALEGSKSWSWQLIAQEMAGHSANVSGMTYDPPPTITLQ